MTYVDAAIKRAKLIRPCKECAHFEHDQCRLLVYNDRDTGDNAPWFCSIARADAELCGIYGKNFQEKAAA